MEGRNLNSSSVVGSGGCVGGDVGVGCVGLPPVNLRRYPKRGHRGEANQRAKLSNLDVRVIRRLRGVLLQAEIAKLFGVSPTTIFYILAGQRWASLPAEHDPIRCK